jgi:branched-chain amino acid transport system ATP-binding protein
MESLRVENLSRDFGGIHAARNVSFKIEEGEHLAIIGPNGAGKTTLFNLISGQMPPTSGKIFFYNQDITHLPAHQRTHLGMARSYQTVNLFNDLTVLENISLALQGTKNIRFQMFRSALSFKSIFAKSEEMLDSIGLWEKKDTPVHSISYGEQRKLEIALSLASEPKLLLLDEPSCGLTSTESTDITTRIRKLGEKITVMLVAHDMDLVFGVAQRIIVLHYGEIITEGTCDQIRTNNKVKEIYMGVGEETAEKC